MAVEIELKYLLDDSALAALLAYQPVEAAAVGAATSERLISVYYDSPDLTLKSHKIALRVRDTGSSFVQTIKGSAKSVDGLSRREEIEWPIPSSKLDLEVLAQSAFASVIGAAGPRRLVPVFTTDFQRRRRDLVLPGNTLVELAIDQGFIELQGCREAIFELELELKGGSEQELLNFSQVLKSDLKLVPGEQSKAQRGYKLFTEKP